MNEITFSFIIPHKNTPDLLQKCIDSIPRRDDVQIIVVDDNSDPNKVDFDHFPGLVDSTVEVYLTKEGRGAGYARNVGLEHAVGKWIIFADADDFFNPCLTEAMDEYKNAEADVVFFKANCRDVKTGKDGFRHLALNERVDAAMTKGSIDELLFFSIPWAKFISRSFICEHQIRFQEVRWGNDVLFSTRCGIFAKQILLSQLAIYCVTERDGSLIKNKSVDAIRTRFEVDCQSSLLMKTVHKEGVMAYWTYQTWLRYYRVKPWGAVKRLRLITEAIGFFPFLRYSWHEIKHDIIRFIKNKIQ